MDFETIFGLLTRLIPQEIKGYGGKCFCCSDKFTNKDVPKWIPMASGHMEKICKPCNDKMGNPGKVPPNQIKKKEQDEKRKNRQEMKKIEKQKEAEKWW